MRLGQEFQRVAILLVVLLFLVLRRTVCIPLHLILALRFFINFLVQELRCSRGELLSGASTLWFGEYSELLQREEVFPSVF